MARGPADWGASRRRFRGAHSRLVQLAEQGDLVHRPQRRREVERLRKSAEDLEGRRKAGGKGPGLTGEGRQGG